MTTPPIADPSPAANGDTQPAPLDGHLLLGQLGRQVSSGLLPALGRVDTLTATGRIDRQSLRALRHEMGSAHRAGLAGQRLAQLSRGRVALAPTRLNLTALLQEALDRHAQEPGARSTGVRSALVAADVICDLGLTSTLLQTALDWSVEHAATHIDLRLELQGWPVHARLRSTFAYASEASAVAGLPNVPVAPVASVLDTLSWRLLERLALVLGLALQRRDARGRTELMLDFPAAPAAPAAPVAAVAAVSVAAPSAMTDPVEPRKAAAALPDMPDIARTRPLAGFHVLVLAARRDVRAQVRDALRGMDLLLDFATSVEEARLFCNDALPQALVYEAAQDTAEFQRLRGTLLIQQPTLGLIQITEEGRSFDVLSLGERDYASVGRDGLMESLPAALMFELFRDS